MHHALDDPERDCGRPHPGPPWQVPRPGDKDNIPLWLTILCGIGGAFLGTWLYSMFFHPETSGIDWWRHLWQLICAMVLVMIASTVTGRNTTGTGRVR